MPASNNSFVSSYSNLTYAISLSSLHLCLEPCFNRESSHFVAIPFLFLTLMEIFPIFCQIWKSDEEFLLNTFYLVKDVLLLLI